MKFILLLLTLIAFTHQIRVQNHDYQGTITSGTSTDWQQFDPHAFYVDIDLTPFNFQELPFIEVSLTCDSECEETTGSNSYFNFSLEGFRVYVHINKP